MMAAVSTTPNCTSTSSGRSWQNRNSPSLRNSETDNNVAAQRRQKPTTREVTSRYISTSSSFSSTSFSKSSNLASRRSASPIASRTVSAGSATPSVTPLRSFPLNNRSQSAERRRPATPTPVKAATGAQTSAAAKVLMSSKRSLSLSFQGESVLTSINKTKVAPSPNLRKSTAAASMTPRNGGQLRENAKSVEQRPWPAKSRQVTTAKLLSKSVDLGSAKKKPSGRSGNVVKPLQISSADKFDQIPCENKLQDVLSNTELMSCDRSDSKPNLENLFISALDSATSDAESICSESNSGLKDNGNMSRIQSGSQCIILPARVWELTYNRLRCLGSSSLAATVSSSRPVNHSSRGSSPLRGGVRSASPSRLSPKTIPSEKSSPSRAMSPSRVRNNTCGAPSVLCFTTDVRRGKLGEIRISDAHLLRLLYNRHLQWRFANSRVEASLSVQKLNAESNLYIVWKVMSDLRLSVSNRRLEFTRMCLKLKLFSILKEQMIYLKKWALLEKDYGSSLACATESFRASTVQLPFLCGATADVQYLKGAICSAVDVLQAMASSICSLMSEAEKISSLLEEAVSIAISERALLDECKDLILDLAAFQVNDCSLRAHISQIKRVPSLSLPIEA